MLTKLKTFSLLGATSHPVDVEVSVTLAPDNGDSQPGFDDTRTTIVGMAKTVVRESAFRVRLALEHSGYQPPRGSILVNLAPADLPKQAASFDLPISLGQISSSGLARFEKLNDYAVIGELDLDGHTRSCRGVLAAARAAKAQGLRGLLVPAANAQEAALVEGIEAIPIETLKDAVLFLQGKKEIKPAQGLTGSEFDALTKYDFDFSEVRGQELAKRAMTIAAAGGHNVLMFGSPGAGKRWKRRKFTARRVNLTDAL